MIEFILNNEKISTAANPSMTLVDFIREDRLLKGTKIVCREGDCGACTVMVGELKNDQDDTPYLKYYTITSCISPLANAQGKHIVTVEGLNMDKKLNHIQQSLKDNYASQCGFCTPGFVMSMTQYCLNAAANSEQQMLDAISGNICRCTGYVSIIQAAKKVVKSAQNRGQKYTLQQLVEQNFIPAYFLQILPQISAINQQDIVVSGKNIIAGGTDLYVQQADTLLQKANARYILNEHGQNVCVENHQCSVSGISTVTDLFDSQDLNRKIPKWQDYLRLVSSEPIRNMATISGNFVNASPIADLSIMMLALDAQLLIADGDESRTVNLKDFFLDYKKIDLQESESIAKINFEVPDQNGHFHFQKVSKRKHLDIATVNSAIHIMCDADGVMKKVSLSVGGVAPVPLFLNKTCQFMIGRRISVSVIDQAIDVMNSEITPISDVRGSKQYKRFLANQMLKGHFIEIFPHFIKCEELVDVKGVLS